ncbi:MAG: LysM peptidoglycan-binding domain-containing protein, partial [Gemmatimonadota bacterium]|nr:LysM peptidoglycan-binding domain-containing protein [Gemmatimonadota bacterium]
MIEGSEMNPSVRRCLGVFGLALLAPASLIAQDAASESHTVKRGDTLWDLARQYLNDPLLWPELYRLNTDVVEDPHWIYPGEILRLGGAPGMAAVPAQDTPIEAPIAVVPADTAPMVEAPADGAAPADSAAPALAEPDVGEITAVADAPEAEPVDLSPLTGAARTGVQSGSSIETALERAYRPVRRSEFYSAGFLSEGLSLPYGTLLGVLEPAQIEQMTNATTAMLYSRVALAPPAGGAYRVGDTLLVTYVDRELDGYGEVVVPTGLLRVTDATREEQAAEVIAVYGRIVSGQRVLPAGPFNDPGNVRPVPIADGVRARVIGLRDRHVLTGPQQIVFLDRGRKDGVALGDAFELLQAAEDRVEGPNVVSEVVATVHVVRVNESTATAMVVKVTRADLKT